MLSEQYRMHPTIAEFPSWRFYNHELRTGVQPEDRPPVGLQGLDLGHVALVRRGTAALRITPFDQLSGRSRQLSGCFMVFQSSTAKPPRSLGSCLRQCQSQVLRFPGTCF